MPIAKKSVTVRIPNELYDMCNKNYGSISNAVIAGLELLFVTNCNKDVITISELTAQIEEKEKTIKELQTQNKEPNIEKYEATITELRAHNETLKKELEKASQDKDKIQNLYDNYMRQIQTLITQKSIETPGSKRPWWKIW
jgi:predicted RNase H-like nuclease (RuvC/YqgF family)